MNYDELAVVCDQLAGMLRAGMTLPEALRELTRTLPQGRMRRELEQMATGLANGTPWAELVERSRLPVLLKQSMAFGNDDTFLAEILALSAGHYRRHHELWSRIRLLLLHTGGLLLLGIGFIAGSLSLAAWFQFASQLEFEPLVDLYVGPAGGYDPPQIPWRTNTLVPLSFWLLDGVILISLILVGFNRAVRERLFWRLPGAKEAQLSLLASGISLLLRRGYSLSEALDIVLASASRHPAWADLRYWQKRLADGYVGLWETTNRYKWFPPLFVWLIDRDGDNLEFGFRSAAEIFEARANYKTSLWQHCLLPIGLWFISGSILAAGIIYFYIVLKPFSGGM